MSEVHETEESTPASTNQNFKRGATYLEAFESDCARKFGLMRELHARGFKLVGRPDPAYGKEFPLYHLEKFDLAFIPAKRAHGLVETGNTNANKPLYEILGNLVLGEYIEVRGGKVYTYHLRPHTDPS